MDFTGKVTDIIQDFIGGGFRITFTVNEPLSVKNGYDAIKDLEKLDIRVTKHREKRSLNANAYAWVLMTKIADVMGSSKDDVYEIMLQRYGCLYEESGGYVSVTVKTSVDMSCIGGHWMLYRDNGQWTSYLMIKGSSDYDTAEMSHFIDGVVSEAKSLGIETLTQRELEEMKAGWTP